MIKVNKSRAAWFLLKTMPLLIVEIQNLCSVYLQNAENVYIPNKLDKAENSGSRIFESCQCSFFCFFVQNTIHHKLSRYIIFSIPQLGVFRLEIAVVPC